MSTDLGVRNDSTDPLSRPSTAFCSKRRSRIACSTRRSRSGHLLATRHRVLLRAHRYVVLLQRPEDRWRAWELGETHRYRYFIVADRGQTHISAPLAQPSAWSTWTPKCRMDSPQPGWGAARRPSGRRPALALRDDVCHPRWVHAGTACGRSIAVANGDFMLGMADANSRPAACRTRPPKQRKPARCRTDSHHRVRAPSASSGVWQPSVRLDYETRAPDHAQLQADYSRCAPPLRN